MPGKKAGEARGFQSPSRYVQGPGEIEKLPAIAKNYGDTVLAIIDTFFYERYSLLFQSMFAQAGMSVYPVEHAGPCSGERIEQLEELCRTLPTQPQVFIGMGGGQACDIAKAVGVSRSHLYRVFIAAVGQSPIDYLTAYRVDEACALLKNTNLSIAEIAVSVGFFDQFYFSRVFKKVKGMPPSRYIASLEKP